VVALRPTSLMNPGIGDKDDGDDECEKGCYRDATDDVGFLK
jgi:hypothetical protein